MDASAGRRKEHWVQERKLWNLISELRKCEPEGERNISRTPQPGITAMIGRELADSCGDARPARDELTWANLVTRGTSSNNLPTHDLSLNGVNKLCKN